MNDLPSITSVSRTVRGRVVHIAQKVVMPLAPEPEPKPVRTKKEIVRDPETGLIVSIIEEKLE